MISWFHINLLYTLHHGQATSGPRARSGPRRPSVRPATLLGNIIAIRPAKAQTTKFRFHEWHYASRKCTHWKQTFWPVPRIALQITAIANQFQALVDEDEVQYSDLLYFCEVHWLSRGAMLSRVCVCDLQKEFATFLRQFFDPRWLARLALLGKDILVTDMHAHITAFEVKLRLWDVQLANGQSSPCCLCAWWRGVGHLR